MIHFLMTFSKRAGDSPFGRRLAELQVAHLIIAAEIWHRYRHRAWMLFFGRPQTAWFAIKAAFRSLVTETQRPHAAVVWTSVAVLVVAAVRTLCGRRGTRIVLVGFILTGRSGALHSALRRLYFHTLFSLVDLTVVHSSVEAARYTALYAGCRSRFVFIPARSHIDGAAALTIGEPDANDPGDVLCAGKTGRDYLTLHRALAATPWRVTTVCDLVDALAGCVVIPQAVGDISASKMVLLQAMKLGKAVVITRNHCGLRPRQLRLSHAGIPAMLTASASQRQDSFQTENNRKDWGLLRLSVFQENRSNAQH